MAQNFDLYDRKGKLERVIARIKSSKQIPEHNRKIILDFHKQCIADGLSSGRMQKLVIILAKLSGWLGKDFDKATRADIIELVNSIEKQDYKEWTKCDYKVVIKKFYKWLRRTEGAYPEEVRWLKTTMKNARHKLPEELLTEEEVLKMIDAADNIRDKALIFTLYESGCRVSELIGLKIKHVQPDKNGIQIVVSGKTGDRRIRLIASSPHLSNWLSVHPNKNDPNSFLWVGMGTRNKGGMIKYSTLGSILRKTAERAGIKKDYNPHLFRHSRATFLAKHLTEAQLKQMFGWTQSSDMAATYVHLSGRDVDNALLKLSGIVIEDGGDESRLKPRKCPRCDTMNSPDSKYCRNCSLVLDVKAALELEEFRYEKERTMFALSSAFASIVGDKDFAKLVQKKNGQLGILKFDDNGGMHITLPKGPISSATTNSQGNHVGETLFPFPASNQKKTEKS